MTFAKNPTNFSGGSVNKIITRVIETSNGVKIRLRTPQGVTFKDFEPFYTYFYVTEEDYFNIEYLIKDYVLQTELVTDWKGEEYRKIWFNDNKKRTLVWGIIENKEIEVFEIDINAPKRLILDSVVPLNQDLLEVAWYDIETFDLYGFSKDKMNNILPAYPILSIAVKGKTKGEKEGVEFYVHNKAIDGQEYDWYRKLRKEYLDTKDKGLKKQLDFHNEEIIKALEGGEKEMLESFFDHVKEKYDVLSSWNGSNFDDNYVRERAKKCGLSFDALMMTNIDYQVMFKKDNYKPRTSFKLKDIAKDELQKGDVKNKKEFEKLDWKQITNADKIFDLFVCYPEILKEYNQQDVNLMDMIEQKVNYFKLHFVQCRLAKCMLQETLYDSGVCDYLSLNLYKKNNMIAKSKPSETQKIIRQNSPRPPGGFTRAYPGYYEKIHSFDYMSQYPTIGVTYNISPDTYRRTVQPDLTKVFSDVEVDYINYVVGISKKYVNKKKKLLKKKYEADIEGKRAELGVRPMEELMYHFIDKYDNNIKHSDNETFTPADINYDTRGWKIHPHFVFDNTREGVYPTIWRGLLFERGIAKVEMKKNKGVDNFKYEELFWYQLGLKILANSLFGVALFTGSRDYQYEIGTAITTSGRYHTKKAVLLARKSGWKVSHLDTDGIYLYEGNVTLDGMNIMFYNYFKEMVKPFNTKCKIELTNPFTKKQETCNYFIHLEYEKSLDKLIVVAKKRYYYLAGEEIVNMGGLQKRSDTNPYAKIIQMELLEDIFYNKFDKEKWKDKLLAIKEKIKNYELEEELLINTKAVQRPLNTYGQPVIDGKTGLQKCRKSDGQPMFAPIPANVQVAKRLVEQGEDVGAGDKISFIVLKEKPKIEPITVEEFRKIKEYDVNYYYKRVIQGVIELLNVVYPKDCYTYFKDCWLFSENQLKKLLEEIDEEDDGEE